MMPSAIPASIRASMLCAYRLLVPIVVFERIRDSADEIDLRIERKFADSPYTVRRLSHPRSNVVSVGGDY